MLHALGMFFIASRLRCTMVAFAFVGIAPSDGRRDTLHLPFNILEVTTLQAINLIICITQMLPQGPWLQALTLVHSVRCLGRVLRCILRLWHVSSFLKLGVTKLSIKLVRLGMNATKRRFSVTPSAFS